MKLLVITGSMGSGKTTVMAEASDVLAARGIAHAAIDLDALGLAHLPCANADDGIALRNLRAVWENYAAAKVPRLLLAAAIESREELDRLRQALPAAEIVVCRLNAPLDTMRERVRGREPGMRQQEFVERVAILEDILERSAVEDFAIANDRRSITEVAIEMLERARWIETR